MTSSTFEARWVALMARSRASHDPLFELPEGAFSRFRTEVAAPLNVKFGDVDWLMMLVAGLALAQLTQHADVIVPLVLPRFLDPDPIRAEHTH